jgi:hypothetical protein
MSKIHCLPTLCWYRQHQFSSFSGILWRRSYPFTSHLIASTLQLDIMYSLENVHFLLDEMVLNGYVVETAKMNVLRPIDLMERESQKAESMFR